MDNVGTKLCRAWGMRGDAKLTGHWNLRLMKSTAVSGPSRSKLGEIISRRIVGVAQLVACQEIWLQLRVFNEVDRSRPVAAYAWPHVQTRDPNEHRAQGWMYLTIGF